MQKYRDEVDRIISQYAKLEIGDEEAIDQIISALQPAIEEARKEERERIIKWGNEECSHPWQPKFRRECPECWQALTSVD